MFAHRTYGSERGKLVFSISAHPDIMDKYYIIPEMGSGFTERINNHFPKNKTLPEVPSLPIDVPIHSVLSSMFIPCATLTFSDGNKSKYGILIKT